MSFRGSPLIYVACGVLIAGAAYLFLRTAASEASAAGDMAWFTTDDGETFFADKRDKIPPFNRDGKTAVGCYVWTCDGGKTRFVSHLYRLTSEGKKLLESNGKLANDTLFLREHSEVKKPGKASLWVRSNDPRAADIQLAADAVAKGEPVPVLP